MALRRSSLAALALGTTCALAPPLALGQALVDGDLQKRVNGVLALMGYMLTPDVTTGALSIANGATGNPDFRMTTLGGGFTLSREFPLYLEGTLGYARYDPTFVASNGQATGSVAAMWDAYSATGGVGWSFPLTGELAFRPIFNFSYGRVDSNVSVSGQAGTGAEIDFLANGRLDAYGLGGSLALDYERYRPENEIDFELRYTNVYLRSFGGSSTAVQGSADSQSVMEHLKCAGHFSTVNSLDIFRDDGSCSGRYNNAIKSAIFNGLQGCFFVDHLDFQFLYLRS